MSQPAGRESTLKRIGLILIVLLMVSSAVAGAALEAVARGDLSHKLQPFIFAGLAFVACLGVVGIYLRTTAIKQLRRRRQS